MPEPLKNREDHLQTPSTGPGQELTEHLKELRDRIIISVSVFVVFFIVCFNCSGEIILFMQSVAPVNSTFFQLKPGELFISSLKVATSGGLVISLPILLHQTYLFLKPGLKDNERKILVPLLWASPILFLISMAFTYYAVLPPLLKFLLNFREGIVETRYGLEHFLNLEMSILILCGLCFQLPIILIVLSYCKIINSRRLLRLWRYAVLTAFIIAAILTPTPDPFTMSILAGAILALYFGTVTLLRFIEKA